MEQVPPGFDSEQPQMRYEFIEKLTLTPDLAGLTAHDCPCLLCLVWRTGQMNM